MAENLVARYKIEDGYVVYRRQSTVQYYEKSRQLAEDNANLIKNTIQSTPMLDKWQAAGRQLEALGQLEFNRERALLNTFLPTPMSDDPLDPKAKQQIVEFIANLNIFLKDKDLFDDARNRIRHALSKDSKNLAPTASTLLIGNIFTECSRRLIRLLNTIPSDVNIDSYIDKQFDSIWDKSVEKAIKKTYDRSIDDQFGVTKTYQEFLDAFYGADKTISAEFKSLVRNQVNITKIKDELKKQGSTIHSKVLAKSNRPGVRAALSKNVSNKFASTFGGSVDELVTAIIHNEFAKKRNIGGAKNLTSNIVAADSIMIYGKSINFDSQPLLDDFNENIKGSANLVETANKMDDYSKNVLSKLDDIFVVYQSDKAYSLGEKFSSHGFAGGGEKAIDQLTNRAAASNEVSDENIKKLIALAKNTIPGAIFDSAVDKAAITRSIEAEVAPLIANLLFDDWTTLGSNSIDNVNTVHIFHLDGVAIPLSVLLVSAGKAMLAATKNTTEFRKYFSFNFSTPNEVLYPEVSSYPNLDASQKQNKYSLIENAWQEQAIAAKEQVKFSTHFLSNFKQKVKEWCDL